MKTLLLSLLLGALSLGALAACSDSDSGDGETPTNSPASQTPGETPSPSPTEQPSPTPTSAPTETPTSEPIPNSPGHALGTRTGVPAIDAFLEARENARVDALGALLQYRLVPCVAPETAEYGVACPDGVAEGTPVSVFVHSACHGASTPENMRDNFAKALTEMPLLVHSLYSTPNHADPVELDPPDRDIALLMGTRNSSGIPSSGSTMAAASPTSPWAAATTWTARRAFGASKAPPSSSPHRNLRLSSPPGDA